jgi:hypothetical protein
MVRRISQGSCEISSWTDIFQSRRDASLAWGLAAFIAVFRREQTPACAVVSLDVGVGVILTAKAPNRRRSLRPFGGRDDAGPRSRNTGERKWTRPHCSSSSSWCCCSAAADSSTDAGFESDGRFARRDHWPPYGTYTGCIGFDVVGVDTAETMLAEGSLRHLGQRHAPKPAAALTCRHRVPPRGLAVRWATQNKSRESRD